MRIKALHDTVFLRRIRTEVTAGGIIVPGTATDMIKRWEVVAVGPGAINPATGERQPCTVQVGDHVLCLAERTPMAIEDGDDLRLMPVAENRILAILEK